VTTGSTPLDIVTAYERTLAWTGACVAAATPSHVHADTPCPEWDVGAVVEHVLSALLAYTMIATEGGIDRARLAPPEAVEDRYQPVYAALAADALAAWRRPGVLDEPCEFLRQTMARRDALAIHVVDVLVHGWDIAVASGAAPGRDDELAVTALALAEGFMSDTMRGSGYWGEAGSAAADAGPWDMLLAFVGRDPQWSPAPTAGRE
jgi:uncharacterized protein (TIGR03086 family)